MGGVCSGGEVYVEVMGGEVDVEVMEGEVCVCVCVCASPPFTFIVSNTLDQKS